MKKLFGVVILLLLASASFAQITGKTILAPNTAPTPTTLYGRMLNLSNTHAYASLDTLYGSNKLYSTTGSWSTSTGLPLVYPVAGTGPITFTVGALHASATSSVNPVVTSQLQSSSDGITWANVPSVSALTVTANSTTVPVGAKVTLLGNYDLYYRFLNTVASDTASVWGQYFLNKDVKLNY